MTSDDAKFMNDMLDNILKTVDISRIRFQAQCMKDFLSTLCEKHNELH